MFVTLKRLYDSGQLSKDGLKNAVEKIPTPWITPEQYKEITGEEYERNVSE